SSSQSLEQERPAITLDTAQLDCSPGNRVVSGIKRRSESSSERPLPAKVVRANVLDLDATQTATKLDGVHSLLHLSEVVQLPAIVLADGVTHLRAAADKSAADIQHRYRTVSQRFVAAVRELKPGFIDGRGIDDSRLSQLDVLVR